MNLRLFFFCLALIIPANGYTSALSPAGRCGGCHMENYRSWKASAHSMSAGSVQFRDTLKEFLRVKGISDGSFCLRCHDPQVMIEGNPFEATENILKGKGKGVTCVICHSVESVRDGVMTFAPGDSPAYHRITDLETMSKKSLCQSCHNFSEPERLDLIWNNRPTSRSSVWRKSVSRVKQLIGTGKGPAEKEIDHRFSEADELDFKTCPRTELQKTQQ